MTLRFRRVRYAHAIVALQCLACDRGSVPADTRAALPPGVAARVGGEDVLAASVQRIASAAGVTLLEARRRAIADALFAAAVRSDPERRADLGVAERGALGRALLERVRETARAAGPITDAELAALTAERWVSLDRPLSVRTTHALVRVQQPSDDGEAHAVAVALAAVLRGAAGADDFIARAKAFPKPRLELRSERVPPVTPDGRIWDVDPETGAPTAMSGSLDLDFTRAAHALAHPGDQSSVVKSSFGYHVILLEERIPEQRLSLDERRALLDPDARARRAQRELDALEARLKALTRIEIERDVEDLTRLVPVGS